MARVIIDTSIWIEFFNRPASPERAEVERLLDQDAISLTGVILAELLQGARTQRDLRLLKETLAALPCLAESRSIWEEAGELSFHLRRQGTTLPLSDLVITVLAREHDHAIYTLDQHFQQIPKLTLHRIP